jgi:hypothetical protein
LDAAGSLTLMPQATALYSPLTLGGASPSIGGHLDLKAGRVNKDSRGLL